MNLQDLKTRSPSELLAFAEELEIENYNAKFKLDLDKINNTNEEYSKMINKILKNGNKLKTTNDDEICN